MFKLMLSLSIVGMSLFASPVQSFDAMEETSYIETTNESAEKETKNKTPDIKSLKETIHPDLSQDEIIERFGKPDEVLTDAMYDLPLWRYDFKLDKEYSNKLGYDSVDFDALKSNKLQYIVMVSFDQEEEKIRNVSIYYLDDKNQIHNYRQFADGYVKDTVIE
ncbi:hypothetical protein [Cytobacillus purgationiresistens]|uniref:Uncharacterized protein n=1 Tax=Cytobacillus purgationiresistens TaxID=863449 RepID=A0ABU0AM56_9BACI|nr:hypothetical protein [Cytobacillus purgationiresistens]MDQ0272336.1 hypothetical protein [Cytobacillus purgationiresistens]